MKKFLKSLFTFSRYADFKIRTDSRELWKQTYPNQNEKIDIFLSILDEAFLVPKPYQFKIQPKDKLGDLYKRSAILLDSFEIEIMVDEIFKNFNYKLLEEELSFEVSFEEIFLKIIQQNYPTKQKISSSLTLQ